MINRMCDTGRGICPHTPQCDHYCQFTSAELAPVYIRSAPLIRFVDEPEPVPDTWQVIGSVLFGFACVLLFVFFAAMFFTGFYIWSLLI